MVGSTCSQRTLQNKHDSGSTCAPQKLSSLQAISNQPAGDGKGSQSPEDETNPDKSDFPTAELYFRWEGGRRLSQPVVCCHVTGGGEACLTTEASLLLEPDTCPSRPAAGPARLVLAGENGPTKEHWGNQKELPN
jgi:hypothetical protein